MSYVQYDIEPERSRELQVAFVVDSLCWTGELHCRPCTQQLPCYNRQRVGNHFGSVRSGFVLILPHIVWVHFQFWPGPESSALCPLVINVAFVAAVIYIIHVHACIVYPHICCWCTLKGINGPCKNPPSPVQPSPPHPSTQCGVLVRGKHPHCASSLY